MSKKLLSYVASRYEEAQATSDELRQRALELIVAACVAEWRHTPDDVVASPSPEPVPDWSEDDVPKVAYDELASRLERSDDEDVEVAPASPEGPEKRPEPTKEGVWWTSPAQPEPTPPPAEPTRGAWDPPRRS
jgi:hypothetical protein